MSKRLEDFQMGLVVLDKHYLAWGLGHGFGLQLPEFIKECIVKIWNNIACNLYGHSTYGLGTCAHCSEFISFTETVRKYESIERSKRN